MIRTHGPKPKPSASCEYWETLPGTCNHHGQCLNHISWLILWFIASCSDISRNQIEVIKSNYFLRAGNIEELNLARNEIHQIEESAFRDLGNLRTLYDITPVLMIVSPCPLMPTPRWNVCVIDRYLSGNKLSDSLQSSSDTVFSTLSKLAKLDLAANRLQTISSKLLQGLPSLQELSLRDNPVTTVESYAFSTPLNLTKLWVFTGWAVITCRMCEWKRAAECSVRMLRDETTPVYRCKLLA